MNLWPQRACVAAGLAWATLSACAQPQGEPIWQQRWHEASTFHFQTYSYAPTPEVARLVERLEQFRQAYSSLAGAEAVASPPIVVVAFPTQPAMAPFLPLYDGQPSNIAGLFSRGSDENLILLALTGTGTDSLDVIYHEFAHLLLRRNERVWPIWLSEGIADVYSTFEVTSDHSARIGRPIPHYLAWLKEKPLMPLSSLFAVRRNSPEYNERERQGLFYAESWLLTHYLMFGNNADHKARFGQFTVLLRQGQPPETAFVNALHVSLPALERELQTYLKRGKLQGVTLPVRASLHAPQALAWRDLTSAEVCFRLGDALMRVGRRDAAQSYFDQVQKLAPASALAVEGPGLLAAERHRHAQAVAFLKEAIHRGSVSYLTHYLYAREQFRLTAPSRNTYTRVEGPAAAVIPKELIASLTLMPTFAPAHYLLGFFELVQGEKLNEARKHLELAVELEPENTSYVLTLAQAELDHPEEARRTLASLCLPSVDPRIRAHAEEMLKQLPTKEK